MNKENTEIKNYSIRNNFPHLVARVASHMGEEYLDMSPHIAARFDPYDEVNSDPRLQVACKVNGQYGASGGSGPKKPR